MTLKRCLNYVGIMRPRFSKYSFQFRELNDNPRSHPRLDQPVKFRESNAASWKAQFTRQGIVEYDNRPWYQGIVVSLSVTVFLVYFCIFREENDIDEELGKTLYDRIEGLEELQLRTSLSYNLDKGLDTKAIEERLSELEAEKLNRN